jgi:hypothetical protein
MNVKSVIMIAYYFPPDGSAAVYRPLRFLKQLVKKGWHATVVCCDPHQYERYDPQLLSQVPCEVAVVRVKVRDPWRALQTWRGVRMEKKLARSSPDKARQVVASHYVPWRSTLRETIRKVEAWIYRPDFAQPWIQPAAAQVQEVCHKSREHVIWATIGPLSSGLAAYRASIATGVPFVLDFRDPWGLDYYAEEVRRPDWARKADNRMMHRMFERAQAVVFMFESIAERYVRTFPEALDRKKIHIIPNGFEGEVETFCHATGTRCKVLYAGNMHTYRYDTLLEAIVRLKAKNLERAKQLHLMFVGEGLRELAHKVADLDITDLVEVSPPISQAEVRRLQQKVHALLVLGRAPGRKGHELVASAKLFAYLQAGRPVIGVVPNDETRRILEQVGSSIIADADSPSEIVGVFEKIIDAWSKGKLESLVPKRAACEVYSSERQTEALIRALEGTSPLAPSLLNEEDIPPSPRGELSELTVN